MATLTPQTIESALQESKAILQAIHKRNGFISNLMATFASSPAVLNGYVELDTPWQKSSFGALERQLIFLAASVENRCRSINAAFRGEV
jgi:hypothetical protein